MQSETKSRTTVTNIPLSEVNNADLLYQRISTEVLINDVDEIPFVPPLQLAMDCQPDIETALCKGCKYSSSCGTDKVLSADTKGLLNFINCKEDDMHRVYKKALGVPSKCRVAKIRESGKKVNLSQGSMVPPIEYVGKSTNLEGETPKENMHTVIVEAVFMGKNLVQANRSYKVEGVVHRDPNNGRLVFLVDKAEGILDDIKGFKLDDKMKGVLKIFQPDEWTYESLKEKLIDIHKEIKINHHQINGREDLAFFMDVTYHSVMAFTWGNSIHHRGWIDLCVCGDTRLGKSLMVERIMNMHQMGYIIAGESVSYAGLMGGVVNQANKRAGNTLHWGVLPKHDQRIVIFDECHSKNALDLWPMLNDVRSSGIAKYNKIIQRQAPAAQRKMFISNPPIGTEVSDYIYPCEMLKRIYQAAETIARFDALVVPRSMDVDPSLVKVQEDIIEPHYYEYDGYIGKMGYKWKAPGYWLLRFIYSRTANQVVFNPEAMALIISESDRLCRKYSSSGIPLVDPGEIHFKLARGCASLAGRTDSVDDHDPETIIVRECHVQVYIEALEAQYDGASNYIGYSKKMFRQTKFKNAREFYEICCNVKNAFVDTKNLPLLERIYEDDMINFKELGFLWQTSSENVLKQVSTAMMTHGLVTPNPAMTNFRKNRKGLMVLRYLKDIELGRYQLISERHCEQYFNKHA